MKWLGWRQWALKARLWQGLTALWFLVRDARTPRLSKAVAWLVLAYALSPIDLIPDFIPVLGYLDDLLIVPLGLWLVLRMVPQPVLLDARVQAAALLAKPRNHVEAACFVLIWLALLVWLLRVLW